MWKQRCFTITVEYPDDVSEKTVKKDLLNALDDGLLSYNGEIIDEFELSSDESFWSSITDAQGQRLEECDACGDVYFRRFPNCPRCGRKMINYKPKRKDNEMNEGDIKEKKTVDHFKAQLEKVLGSIRDTKMDIEMTLRMLNGADTYNTNLSKADYMHARLYNICTGADTSIRNLDNLCSDIHNFEDAIVNSYVGESEEKLTVTAEWLHSITEVPDNPGVFKVRLICSECGKGIPIGKRSNKCPHCGANMINYEKED